MKRLTLFIIGILIIFFSHARDMVITKLNQSPIRIGNRALKVGDTFSDTEVISWSSIKQDMKAKPKSGGLPRHYSAAAFKSKSQHNISIQQYLKYLNKTNRPSTLDVGDLYLQKSENSDKYPEKRIALVIGNSIYGLLGRDLDCPISDAEDVTATLNELGFDTYTLYDATNVDFHSALMKFSNVASAGKYDVALFYFCGHGSQNDGKNYLLPVDAKNDSPEDISTWISFDAVFESLSETGCKTKLVFLDACRNAPRWQAHDKASRLDQYDTMGSLVVYSTANNMEALGEQEEESRNTPFGAAFLESVLKPAENISLTIKSISESVRERTGYYTKYGESPRLVYTFGVGDIDFSFVKADYDEFQSIIDAKKAHELYQNGDPITAITLLYNSLQHLETKPNSSYCQESAFELRSILNDSISIKQVLIGHIGEVDRAYYTKDNTKLITIGVDSTMRVWDVNNGTQIYLLSHLIDPIVSKDKHYLISYSDQINGYQLFDIATGKYLLAIDCNVRSMNKGFTNDSEHFYLYDKSIGLNVWNLKTGKLISKINKSYYEYQSDLSSDGSLLAYTVNNDNESIFELWDITSNQLLFRKEYDRKVINQAIFSNDDKFIFTCGENSGINKWDKNGTCLNHLELNKTPYEIVEINDDQNHMIIGLYGGEYALISLDSNSIIQTFSDTYIPLFNKEHVITIRRGDYKLFEAWSIIDGHKLSEFGPYIRNSVTAISDNGSALLTLPSGNIVLFDIPSGQRLGELHYNANMLSGMNQYGGGAVFSSDGKSISVADVKGNISIWSVNSLSASKDLSFQTSFDMIDDDIEICCDRLIIGNRKDSIEVFDINQKTSSVFSCDLGMYVAKNKALYVGQTDIGVNVYNINTLKLIKTIKFPDLSNITLNSQGTLLSLSRLDSLYLYDIRKNEIKELQNLTNGYLSRSETISPDGKYIATLVDLDLRTTLLVLWETESGKIIFNRKVNTKYYCNLSFSHSSDLLASIASADTILLIRPDNGEIVQRIVGHNLEFRLSRIAPNDKYIASFGYNSMTPINIWDMGSGKLVKSLNGEKYSIIHGCFSEDSRLFYAFGYLGPEKSPSDFKLYVWDTSNWSLLYSKSLGKNKIFYGEQAGFLVFFDWKQKEILLEKELKDDLRLSAYDLTNMAKSILHQ